jgi:hypothetical protein
MMQMRARRIIPLFAAAVLVAAATFAQVGRGWSDWSTPYGDAQRTSWLRTDPNISIESMSKPGFGLQWTTKLENQRRGPHGLTHGVTASGVTLFVPISLVAGSSNNLYMLDNDTGYVVWSRTFEGTLPAATGACVGGITAAPTRIVSAMAEPTPPPGSTVVPAGRGNQQGYRSLLGEPGAGIPVEARGGGGGGAGGGRGAAAAPPARQGGASDAGRGQGRGQSAGIPGAPNVGGGGLGRAMVGYAVSGDGQLRVVGLQSGKDLQKPAPFLPPNSQWSNPVAVGTMMYAATFGNCAGAANGVYAIDLDSPDKPVVSYRTNGGSIVGAVAFSSDGNTLLAAIGPGSVTGDGKANAIVALDPRTLQLKDWFAQPTTEFVTGPHGVPLRDKGRRRRCDEGRSRGAPGFGLAGRSESRDGRWRCRVRLLRMAARSQRQPCRPGRARRLQPERSPRSDGFSFRCRESHPRLARQTGPFATAPWSPSALPRRRARCRSSLSGRRSM